MPYSPEDLYAMACMAMEASNHNPNLTEEQRNDCDVFASQHMGSEQTHEIEPEMNQ